MSLLVTGGCGFIGSNFVRLVSVERPGWDIINLDKLTYAGNPANLRAVEGDARYRFVCGDVRNRELVEHVMRTHAVEAVVHLAAESHVDRSILGPGEFVETNIVGTQVLLDAARRCGVSRFLLVSTDEVYGSVGAGSRADESSPVDPSSPYAASKASAELLARACHRTYGQQVVVARGANTYGPYQFPEKLIPLAIVRALQGEPVPVYGDGHQRREWLHVEDHCRALLLLLERGAAGGTYNVGSGDEQENLAVVRSVLAHLDRPDNLIRFVADRPGHDRRYAGDSRRLRGLGWAPAHAFASGLAETVAWYVAREDWWRPLLGGRYQAYYEAQYRGRLEADPPEDGPARPEQS